MDRRDPHTQRLRKDFASLALVEPKRPTTGRPPGTPDSDAKKSKVPELSPSVKFLIQYAEEKRELLKNKIRQLKIKEKDLPDNQKTKIVIQHEEFEFDEMIVEDVEPIPVDEELADVIEIPEPITDEETLYLIDPDRYDSAFDEGAGEEGFDDMDDYSKVFDES